MLILSAICMSLSSALLILALPGLLVTCTRSILVSVRRGLDAHMSNHRIGIDAHWLICSWLVIWLLLQSLTMWASGSLIVCTAVTAIMLWLPGRILHILAVRRRDAIERALPDALAVTAAAMRAGATVITALQVYVSEHDGPLAQEFDLMLGEYRLGTPLHQALEELGRRLRSEDMDLMLAAVAVSTELGGQLADILLRLSATIRKKHETQGRVRALSAQGIMQGRLILMLPYVILFALLLLESDAMQPLFTGLLGWITLTGMLLLQFTGVLMIRSITRFAV